MENGGKVVLRIKRVYEPEGEDDGARVLVDRLWPRGVTKADANISWWARELAPSTDLRRWFGHDPARFDEFARRYRDEIADKPELFALRRMVREGPVTLIYGARDQRYNNAVALRALLEE